jgi:hypothetical protein
VLTPTAVPQVFTAGVDTVVRSGGGVMCFHVWPYFCYRDGIKSW